ncbi:MAG: hypothetical protein LBG69_02690 [Zoogloeaceae bacterium]|jgi:hypothetical protein|nr:hypothetical protein [Zoogloeaceae bacterium]
MDASGEQVKKTLLYTDERGFSRFREEWLALPEGMPQTRLSQAFSARSVIFRQSPPGFRSDWHCTDSPQWTFILAGGMEIGLRDGSSRLFQAGDWFFSGDTLPEGEVFDVKRHGHWSAQRGDAALVTLFVKAAADTFF